MAKTYKVDTDGYDDSVDSEGIQEYHDSVNCDTVTMVDTVHDQNGCRPRRLADMPKYLADKYYIELVLYIIDLSMYSTSIHAYLSI